MTDPMEAGREARWSLIRDALSEGVRSLASTRERLDAINVFPVPDGDTGSNLVDTVRVLERAPLHPAKDPAWASEISQSLLLGSRGNSGILFASFLSGIIEAQADAGDLLPILKKGVKEGRKRAYEAVAVPLPGTILTAMDALEDALGSLADPLPGGFAQRLLGSLEAAVDGTTMQLETLTRAGVVDAGALGLCIFIDGFLRRLAVGLGQNAPEKSARIETWLSRVPRLPAIGAAALWEETPGVRCVDLLLRMAGEPDRQWIQALEQSVTSLEWTRAGEFLKIHLHTAMPDLIREWAVGKGTIVGFRTSGVESVLEARSDRFGPMAPGSGHVRSRFRIITDSSASLPLWLARREGIRLFCNYVRLGDELLRDDQVDPSVLYRKMKEGIRCTTARPSAGEVRRFLEDLASTLEPDELLLYIGVGPRYAAGIELIEGASRTLGIEDRIHVFDTHAASGQLAAVAMAAAWKSGTCEDLAEMIRYVEDRMALVREYLVLDTLEHLARGGRIGRLTALAGGLLSMKPVVGHGEDGPRKLAVVRSREEGIDFILDDIRKSFLGCKELQVLVEETDSCIISDSIAEKLKMILGNVDRLEILIVPLSASAGVHMGPGTLGVAIVPL